jgi:hypothetical protein
MAPLPKAFWRAARPSFLGAFAAVSALALAAGSNPAAAEFQIGVYGSIARASTAT